MLEDTSQNNQYQYQENADFAVLWFVVYPSQVTCLIVLQKSYKTPIHHVYDYIMIIWQNKTLKCYIKIESTFFLFADR